MSIKWMIKKSDFYEVRKSVNKEADSKTLEQLKKEVIAILENKDSQEYKKAIKHFEKDESKYSRLEKSVTGEWIEKAGYGVGTVRIWKGKKYKKIAQNKWVRVFDKNDRGAATSMGKYIAQVKKCSSVEELYQFCMKQRSLFQDENGNDLPIMDKLRSAIDKQSGLLEQGEKVNARMKEYQKEDLAKLKAGNYSFDSFADFKAEIKKQGNDFRGSKQPNYIGYLSQYNDNYLQQVYDAMPKTENPDYPFKPKTEKERAERAAFEKDRDDFIERMDKIRQNEQKKDSKVLSNGKTVKEVREQYGIKVDKKENSITTNMGKKITESELKDKIKEKEDDVKESQNMYEITLKEKGENSKYTRQALINLNTDKQSLKRWNNWLDAMKNGDIKESDFDENGNKKDVSEMSKDEILSEMAKQVKLKNNKDENYYEKLKNELDKINKISDKAKKDAGDKINVDDYTLNKLGKKIDGEYPKFNKEQQKKLFSRIIEEFGESEKARKLIQNMQDFNSQKGESLDINSYGDSWDYMKKQVGIEESESETHQNRSDAMKGKNVSDMSDDELNSAISEREKRIGELEKENIELYNRNFGFGSDGAKGKDYENWLANGSEMKKLQKEAAEYSIERGKRRATKEDSGTKVNGYGEATNREITSGTYERAQKRKQKDVDRFLGVKKGLLDLIDMLDESENEETDFEDNDASQPDLFNSPAYKVSAALDSVFGCR